MSRTKRLIVWGLGLFVIAGVLTLAAFSLNAYREMRKLQTGTLWHLPTRIYGSPLELAPGMDIHRSGLAERLSRLRYRKVDDVREPGQYLRSRGGMTIFLRPFAYPEGTSEAVKVTLDLDGHRLTRIVSGHDGRILASVRLEPETIASLFDAGFEDREIVSLQECPPHLIDALICAEDRRFFSHRGVDLRSMGRALLADMFHRRVVEGGSTITQQLVKNLFLTHERTVSRKIREVWLALIMEAVFTKDEILGMYINEVYLGRCGYAGIHGFGRASRVFLDKGISGLELHEAALLAGLVRSPNRYSPYTHPKAALERRNTVLALMEEQGKLRPGAYREALRRPLDTVPFVPAMKQAPYFVDHVLASVRDLFPGEEILSRGGLGIFTTLDMHVQRIAEGAVTRALARHPENLQAASVTLRPATGEILSMVGGRDYRASQFNRAVALRRNVGSLIKPAIYHAALRNGYTLASMLDDSPLTVPLPDGSTWSPANYDAESHGEVLLIDALVNSYNQATVRLGLALGLETVRAGVAELVPGMSVPGHPSLLLGAIPCSPLDVAAMYAVFASKGMRSEPWCLKAVLDRHGAVLWRGGPASARRVLEEGEAFLVDTALQEVMRRGTARTAARFGVPDGVCGKTGTTNDLRDSWFAAYTGDLVTVAWMGDDAYKVVGLTGASGALPVAGMIMAATAGPHAAEVPDGVSFFDIDPATGGRAGLWTASPRTLPFLAGTEPARSTPVVPPWVIETLRSLWPWRD